MRPKLGSPPCSAVFTSGELAIARATGSTASGAAANHDPAHPARALAVGARSRARAGAAARRAPRRGAARRPTPARPATPTPPFASANTVSLVESWPSTLMRSKERLTHTPVSRSSVSCAIAASVWMKQNIVAKRGSIMPAPFAWAASLTRPAREVHVEAGALRAAVAREDRLREALGVEAELVAGAVHARRPPSRAAARARSRRSRRPRPGSARGRAGARPPPASPRPCRGRAAPSPTFEQPELATTARRPARSACFDAITGRAQRARSW